MKILVFSDSHRFREDMIRTIQAQRPDAVIHLGDYARDVLTLRERFPGLPIYQVRGNCDGPAGPGDIPEIQTIQLEGVTIFMTHGHLHRVKLLLLPLLAEARANGAAICLYGHTHRADCHQESDGLWVLNPGASGGLPPTAGLIQLEQGKILDIRLLCRQ